ncbi:MAG: leucine-rich repeat domain-containing protein [Candidatus Peribacteria bacterium]|nr:leucine-rich repeat domain-containing protein [Candidatus Peribacteria bacterium]
MLQLNNNEIATIQAGAFNGSKVSQLDLSYNKLSTVPTKESL